MAELLSTRAAATLGFGLVWSGRYRHGVVSRRARQAPQTGCRPRYWGRGNTVRIQRTESGPTCSPHLPAASSPRSSGTAGPWMHRVNGRAARLCVARRCGTVRSGVRYRVQPAAGRLLLPDGRRSRGALCVDEGYVARSGVQVPCIGAPGPHSCDTAGQWS